MFHDEHKGFYNPKSEKVGTFCKMQENQESEIFFPFYLTFY